MHIKEQGLLKILQGIGDRDAIDVCPQDDVLALHLCAEELFRPCLWGVGQEGPVEGINEREEQRGPRGNGARPHHGSTLKTSTSERPHMARLAFGAVFSRDIADWVDAGRHLKSPLPPRRGPCTIRMQTTSKSYLQKWGVKPTLLDRLTPYGSIPRFLWHESFILPLRRMVAHQNALQRVRSA